MSEQPEVPVEATLQSQLPDALPASAPEEPFHGETFTISQTLLTSLLGMGFSENAIFKSIAAGCINEDTCVQWISMHAGHPELDTPLAPNVRVTVKQKIVLTEEQRAEKAAELKDKIRVTKEREEKEARESQLKAELARIQTGKLMHEAKELRDAQQRANAFADMKKEKEADARAREKALLQVAIDKLVRQGMTAEEATVKATREQEEKKQKLKDETAARLAEQQQAKKSEPAAVASSGGKAEWNLAAVLGGNDPAPTASHGEFSQDTVADPTAVVFAAQVSAIRSCGDAQKVTECVSTLRLIVSNIVQSPLDLQKRSLKATTNVFTKKIAPVPGAVTFLRMCGFSPAADANGQQLLIMNSLVLRVLYRALAALDSSP